MLASLTMHHFKTACMVMEKSLYRNVIPGRNVMKINTHNLLPPMLWSPHAHLYENWSNLNANPETDVYLGITSVMLQKSAGLPQVLHLSKQISHTVLRIIKPSQLFLAY